MKHLLAQARRARLAWRVALLMAALLLIALIWAKARDPFQREWLTLRTPDGQRVPTLAVMPDRGGPFPVVFFAHGSGGSVLSSGEALRLMASQGLAVVGFDYSQTNQGQFDRAFAALNERVLKRPWARKGAVVWAGQSLGAQRQLSYLARHPERKPALLVRLNAGWVEDLNSQPPVRHSPAPRDEGGSTLTSSSGTLNPLHAWMAHGELDEVFPLEQVRRVEEWLRSRGAEVEVRVFPGRTHGFGEDQMLLVKLAAEHAAERLGAPFPRPAFRGAWTVWLAPAALAGFLFGPGWVRRRRRSESNRPPRWLVRAAWGASVVAVLLSGIRMGLPVLPAGDWTLSLARYFCVRPALRGDFDWLAAQPRVRGHPVGHLLDHVELADLQRGRFGQELTETQWREQVLSPFVSAGNGDIGWRRVLWETLAPRVRRETDPGQAAAQVERYLRLRVTPVAREGPARGIRECWESGRAIPAEMPALRVAALRSVGIAAMEPKTKPEDKTTNEHQ